MIVIKLMGGLGNQCFQYAYGLALETRGYTVAYDKSHMVEGTHREYSLGEYFDLQFSIPTMHAVYENGLRFDPDKLNPRDGSTMIGYWQTEKYIGKHDEYLRGGFNFHWARTPLSLKAQEINEKIYKSGNSVCFHVRRQDYVGLEHIHGMPSIEYYRRAWLTIKDQKYLPSAFVFSDDPEWCYENFPSDFCVVKGTTKYDDLRLMASCKHAVIANSSFGWWGAWIGDNQLGRIVIAPEKWFTDPSRDSTDIVPDRWIKL